jgi:tRNA(Ile)-lysidine synthase
VSGGGDSLALMHLLAAHAARRKLAPPLVLTVDHRLRPGAARDARQVKDWAEALGLPARILTWTGPRPARGIEAAARDARYRLMGRALARAGIATLCVGHSQDDQAETFLLRLQRGSGLDGLAAMQAFAPYPVPGFDGLSLARPLLDLSRAELRAFLSARKQPWLEDPMNDDTAFARVKLRQALAGLDILPARIAAAAAHLARARAALDIVTDAVLARAVRPAPGGLLLDAKALTAAPRELGLRGLASLLMTVSGQGYRPRFEALERLYDGLAAGTLGGGVTLHGCRLGPAPAKSRVFGPATVQIAPEPARRGSPGP